MTFTRGISHGLGLCALVVLLCAQVAAGQITATWTGGGDGINYSDPNNWNIGVVPLNDGNTYEVVLQPSGTVHFDVDVASSVTDFTLGSGTTLIIDPGHSLTVLDDTLIGGYVQVDNAEFYAQAPGAAFDGSKARLSVAGGGTIAVYGTSYSSTGLYSSGNHATYTLFSASGADSLLDLSELVTINAAVNDGRDDRYTYQVIQATNSGHIDLSSLQTITGPVRSDDYLKININNAGTMDLSSLQTTGGGNIQFNVDTLTFTLPWLLNASRTTFNLTNIAGGTLLDLPQLSSFSSGTINVPISGSLSAPLLTTFSGNLNVGESGDANLASMDTFSNGTLSLGPNSVVYAPNLTNFLSAVYTAAPGRTLDAPAFADIDNSRLAATGGVELAVAATTYATTGLYSKGDNVTYTILSATDANSLLDLSSLTSINARFNDERDDRKTNHKIVATAGGRVDLSNVSSITGPARAEDRLYVQMSGGGVVDLSGLAQTLGGTVQFDIADVPGSVYSLPQLVSTKDTSFYPAAGIRLELPSLTTFSGGTISVGSAGSLEAPSLTSLSGSLTVGEGGEANMPSLDTFANGTLTIEQDATVNAPSLTNFLMSSLTLGPNQTLSAPPLEDIDNSRLAVTGGVDLAVAATSYSSTSLYSPGNHVTYTILSASGGDSLLDLSSLTSIDTSFDDARYDRTTNHKIVATAGGRVDLSNVSSITGPARVEDRLYIQMSGGGVVDLSSLAQTLGGNIQFDIADVPGSVYSLPQLTSTKDTSFYPAAGIRLEMPLLTTFTGGTISVGSAGSLEAPSLTSLSGSLTVGEGGEANMPSLDTFSNGTLTIEQDAAVNAPSLTNFLNASLTLGPNQTLNAPPLEDIDNSRLGVTGGVELAVAATLYSSTSLYNPGNHATYTILSASDPNSLLDLSSLTSINAGFNDGRYDRTTNHKIVAGAGGRIDLSSVASITGPARSEDALYITADSNSEVDLSGLQAVSSTGPVYVTVGGQAKMLFGDLTVSTNMAVSLTDSRSELDVAGSLLLDGTSSLSAVAGSMVTVGEDLTFAYTDEARLNLDQGIVQMDGAGLQFLEIGSEDTGLPEPNDIVTGNFAMGQLVIGEPGELTTVQLRDVIDNGNRTKDDAPEALYLNGLGGPDGLIIAPDCILILDNLNVYTTENNEWVHLNGLFGPGETMIEYSDGWLELPEPATLTLLAIGAAGLLLRRRRRR